MRPVGLLGEKWKLRPVKRSGAAGRTNAAIWPAAWHLAERISNVVSNVQYAKSESILCFPMWMQPRPSHWVKKKGRTARYFRRDGFCLFHDILHNRGMSAAGGEVVSTEIGRRGMKRVWAPLRERESVVFTPSCYPVSALAVYRNLISVPLDMISLIAVRHSREWLKMNKKKLETAAPLRWYPVKDFDNFGINGCLGGQYGPRLFS